MIFGVRRGERLLTGTDKQVIRRIRSSPMAPLSNAALSFDQVRQVMRYWLASVRFEGAFGARPKARRVDPRRAPPSLVDPGYGQEYFRVGAEHAAFFLRATPTLSVPLDAVSYGFFERWLRNAYYVDSALKRKQSNTRTDLHVAGFPVLHFEKRGELAALFRFPVEIEPRLEGEEWALPAFTARAHARHPDSLWVRNLSESTAEDLPLFLDVNLLHRALGVSLEDIEELNKYWADTMPSAPEMIRGVLKLLGAPCEEKDPAQLFSRLVTAAQARSERDLPVYAMGMVAVAGVDATHHLQRELGTLISLTEHQRPMKPGSALRAYLAGERAEPRRATLRGRICARPMTERQLQAIEQGLGSVLSAIEGPPGTGKTELIAHLAAHVVVERGEQIAERQTGSEVFVIASTNNRAVDNALELIERELGPGRLPVALRAGSQEVTRSLTVAALRSAATWLEGQDRLGSGDKLAAARNNLKSAQKKFELLVSRFELPNKKIVRLAEIRERVTVLEDTLRTISSDQTVPPGAVENLESLRVALENMRELAESPGKKTLPVLQKKYSKLEAAQVVELTAHYPELVASLKEFLPPKEALGMRSAEACSLWEEGLDEALGLLGEVSDALDRVRGRELAVSELTRLLAEQSALEGAELPPPPPQSELDAGAHAYFLAALELRERWAIDRADALLTLLKTVAGELGDTPSLRRVLGDGTPQQTLLFQLFPVIGSTLLSLGNIFPEEPEAIARLVIDEGGQCHPAYAVSGISRAEKVLVAGDIHQLTPVVELSEADEAAVRRSAAVTIDPERFEPYRIHARAETSAQHLANRTVGRVPRLIDHFRCQAEIIALSDRLAGYGLTVRTPRRSSVSRSNYLSAPVILENIPGEQQGFRGSWMNSAELAAVFEKLELLLAAGIRCSEIALLTPYVAQLEKIRDGLRQRKLLFDDYSPNEELLERDELATGTIHRFQGGERSIVLLSTVATTARSLRFLDERPNLLNVAISRARDHLIVFGHRSILAAGARTRVLCSESRERDLEVTSSVARITQLI